jgi:hypothetical protein
MTAPTLLPMKLLLLVIAASPLCPINYVVKNNVCVPCDLLKNTIPIDGGHVEKGTCLCQEGYEWSEDNAKCSLTSNLKRKTNINVWRFHQNTATNNQNYQLHQPKIALKRVQIILMQEFSRTLAMYSKVLFILILAVWTAGLSHWQREWLWTAQHVSVRAATHGRPTLNHAYVLTMRERANI